MTRDYRQGIKGILSLGPAPRKPRIIKSETDPYEDVFSPDAPVVLTPGVNSTATPTDKFGNTKTQKDKMINDYIAKPAPTDRDIQNKEFWGAYNNSEKMVEYINKYGEGDVTVKYDKDGYPDKANTKQMNDLANRLQQSRQMTGHKKYPVKPSAQNKKPWRYIPWGSEVNVRPERSQKARITTKTNKEKPDEQI